MRQNISVTSCPEMVLNLNLRKSRQSLQSNRQQRLKNFVDFWAWVHYYRDLWAKRSEMLAPLTDLVGECGYSKSDKKLGKKKVPWHWDKEHQKASDDVKATIAKDVALAYPYPDFSKDFEIYTDDMLDRLELSSLRTTGPWRFGAVN
jgi:hypothetical protein